MSNLGKTLPSSGSNVPKLKPSLNPSGSPTSKRDTVFAHNPLTLRKPMMRPNVSLTTNLIVYFVLFLHSQIANAQNTTAADYEPPLFRAAVTAQPPPLPAGTTVRLLADDDFAPYSFLSSSGAPGGLSVELAMAACAQLAISCTVTTLPFAEIMPALARGDADAAIAGPRLDETTARAALATRPYFRTMGRFAVQTGNPARSPDAAALSGKRIAVAANTVHAHWLKANFASSEIVPFDDPSMASDALRTGAVDALFGDNVQLIYWISGPASGACCRLLGGAFTDFQQFSRNFVFLVRPQKPELRAALDYGLDMAQTGGDTARIIKAYLPLSPW
jgi:polar amino acid transport system substrate-binding protein